MMFYLMCEYRTVQDFNCTHTAEEAPAAASLQAPDSKTESSERGWLRKRGGTNGENSHQRHNGRGESDY